MVLAQKQKTHKPKYQIFDREMYSHDLFQYFMVLSCPVSSVASRDRIEVYNVFLDSAL